MLLLVTPTSPCSILVYVNEIAHKMYQFHSIFQQVYKMHSWNNIC